MTQKTCLAFHLLVIGFFLTACSSIHTPNPIPTTEPTGSLQIYTARPAFTGWGSWELVISNTTAATLTIPTPRSAQAGEATYRFYRQDAMGWERLITRPGYMAEVYDEYTHPDNSHLQIAGHSAFTLDFSRVMAVYFALSQETNQLEGIFIVQVRYQHEPVLPTPNELVQYTNEFTINQTMSVDDLEIAVKVNNPQRDQIEVQNNSTETLRIPSVCSQENGYDTDDYSSLQRLTSEGTWEVFRPQASFCKKSLPVVVIPPGSSTKVDVAQWVPLGTDIAPGIYRWDVVILFERKYPGHDPFQYSRHVFSPTFEIMP
jgi:hypothetical protein